MIETQQCRGVVLTMLTAFVFATSAPQASAFYLDEERNVSLRMRISSQLSIRIEDSSTDTVPTTKAGQMVQHRNFANPELDIDLTSWLAEAFPEPLRPDDLRFRAAGWAFYDGIYDYGPNRFNYRQKLINSTYADLTDRGHAFYIEGSRYNPQGTSMKGMFPHHKQLDPQVIYAKQGRINELYLSYSKGPVFLRIGRQAISWGESDTIGLLDANNPFDITLGAPGVFQDLEEARIPLWTLRGSLKLFEVMGPMSSGFLEAYWVPGQLDTNTGWFPLLTASPYSPRGQDPQTLVPPIVPIQFVMLDKIPRKRHTNSRWGVKFETIIDRSVTLQAWYYTQFPNAPVPLSLGTVRAWDQAQIFTTATIHELTPVIGLATSFFAEPLDGIIRAEAEYFYNEPGFIPQQNLGIKDGMFDLQVLSACSPDALGNKRCSVPKADMLRWEIGFDRFFFFRPLNPTNSFTLITAVVGQYNLDETDRQDFRYNGQRKPGRAGTDPDHFVQLKKVAISSWASSATAIRFR